MAQRIIHIEGMSCEGCSGRIERILNKIPEVLASVSLQDKKAVVEAPDDIPDKDIEDAITRAGFTVTDIIYE